MRLGVSASGSCEAQASKEGRGTAQGNDQTGKAGFRYVTERMLEELPKVCGVGTERNSKGHQTNWIGYKLHIDAVDGGVPVVKDPGEGTSEGTEVFMDNPGEELQVDRHRVELMNHTG